MSKDIEDKLDKIPIINVLVLLLKKVKLPGKLAERQARGNY